MTMSSSVPPINFKWSGWPIIAAALVGGSTGGLSLFQNSQAANDRLTKIEAKQDTAENLLKEIKSDLRELQQERARTVRRLDRLDDDRERERGHVGSDR